MAFTIIELIVVITVIVLVLSIAVPGLSAVGLESRFNAATQTISAALTRAYYASLADVNMTAVRFVPGEWDFNAKSEAQRGTGRQHLVTYSYVGTTAADPTQPNTVEFGEYFQRREATATIQLPDDIWVAPIESLEMGARTVAGLSYQPFGEKFVLSGTRGQFQVDSADTSAPFLKADDFTVLFDPQTGMRGGLPTPVRLRAYLPPEYMGQPSGVESDRWPLNASPPKYFQRYSFSGIVIYRREPFVTLGEDATVAPQRQDYLRAHGRPYLVHRLGGALVMGTQESQ